MEQSQQDTTSKPAIFDFMDHAESVMNTRLNDDSIRLQSSEAIALNGLLSDLEFTARSYELIAEEHYKNYAGEDSFIKNTPEESIVASGIYANKAQDMRDLVNKWKPNKK